MQDLVIYNTLHRKKELFQPIAAPNVGMYVCGPTVYGDPHLGHARPAITFDILFRYLKHIGYKVRYVRNITDVGHLEHDADEGDDKIEKKARLEQLEPMEIAQHYTNRYHDAMRLLNVLPPSIEPHATGHIIEQEELVKQILTNGYAYESNGSMPSPWSDGFPGWHCECTAMGRKYLGDHFDIHGGGMDLIFPHHECEIAQAVASQGDQMVKYWMHNNMITINGQKMGKSLGNFITLEQFFTGNHKTLTQAYSPMTIRFFILSAHYRGTVDFSNEALQAAEKGYERLMNGIEDLARIQPAATTDENTKKFVDGFRLKCYDAMNDDLMTPAVISTLFEACHLVNILIDHKAQISADDLRELTEAMQLFAFDILGLQNERGANNDAREEAYGKVVDMVLDLRAKAKAEKNWAVSDQIRDALADAGFQVKDTKDGVTWKLDR